MSRPEAFYKVKRIERGSAIPSPDIAYWDAPDKRWYFFGDPQSYTDDEVVEIGDMVDPNF